MRYKLL